MNDRVPGKLIAFEGLDGSGKSTQVYLLLKWLESLKCRVYFSEWNSSDIVKTATKKGKKKQLLTPTTFSLIHATDFTDRYERQILPMLKAGYIVLCDRYIFTSFARDGVRGCDPEWLRKMYGFAITPHIAFYFRLPLSTALDRILTNRSSLKYFEAGMDLALSADITQSFRLFQEKIMEQYDKMADEFRFTIIDATRAIPFQQEIIRSLIMEKTDLSQFKLRVRK